MSLHLVALQMFDKMGQHAGKVSLTGAISGWAAVDLLRTAQITLAIIASLVSLCSLIIALPRAVQVLSCWKRNLLTNGNDSCMVSSNEKAKDSKDPRRENHSQK